LKDKQPNEKDKECEKVLTGNVLLTDKTKQKLQSKMNELAETFLKDLF